MMTFICYLLDTVTCDTQTLSLYVPNMLQTQATVANFFMQCQKMYCNAILATEPCDGSILSRFSLAQISAKFCKLHRMLQYVFMGDTCDSKKSRSQNISSELVNVNVQIEFYTCYMYNTSKYTVLFNVFYGV